MQSFIVLGLIPGTNIQINFLIWVVFFSILAALAVLFIIKHISQIKSLTGKVISRKVLPASHLHSRLQ
jgi:hypothetical protein